MKAIVLKDKVKQSENKKAPLYFEDVETPEPEEGEVLVRIHHAALNRRDVFIQHGAYPGIQVPVILGSDGSGYIEQLGEGVQGLEVGKEVVINPCVDWRDNQAFPSSDQTILGLPRDGTFAQYVKVPAENVFAKPKHLTFEEAAAIPLGGLTAYRAVFTKGEVQKGTTVVIPGIGGGVATFAMQMAVAIGARVYVTSSSDAKIKTAKAMGAAGGVNYRSDNWAKELKEMTGGADVSIDSIGGETFNDLIYIAKPASRIVSFGATTGPVKNVVMPRIFFKQLQILGTTMGSPHEFERMLSFYGQHELKPFIDSVYPLEKTAAASDKMDEGNLSGKIVISVQQ